MGRTVVLKTLDVLELVNALILLELHLFDSLVLLKPLSVKICDFVLQVIDQPLLLVVIIRKLFIEFFLDFIYFLFVLALTFFEHLTFFASFFLVFNLDLMILIFKVLNDMFKSVNFLSTLLDHHFIFFNQLNLLGLLDLEILQYLFVV